MISGNTTLDIFIGLSLIFLLYSLLASSIQEIVARWFGLRGRMMVKAVRRMLSDDAKPEYIKRVTILSFIVDNGISFVRFFYPYFLDYESMTKAFFDAPSIKYLSENSWNSKPGYVEASTFSQTMIYLLRGQNITLASNQMELIRSTLFNNKGVRSPYGFLLADETAQTLQNYYTDSGGDLDKFKTLLEDWFNETMNRATGWYKKQCQMILLITGFFLASYNNIDAVKIYHILSENSTVRLQLVNMAMQNRDQLEKIVKQQEQVSGLKLDSAARKHLTSAVPDSVIINNYNALQVQTDNTKQLMGIGHEKGKYAFNLGCLITAIAISLGANFWFDLLSKFISLRASGNKPEEQKNTKSETIKRVG